MDRVGQGCVVDEPDNSFPAFLHDEGRTRGDAIVSNKVGFSQVGVDTLLKGQDIDFVVVDRLVCNRVGDSAGVITGQ